MSQQNVKSLQELNALFLENKDSLGEEEQRLFQAIMLEMNKGEQMDTLALARMVEALGRRAGIYGA